MPAHEAAHDRFHLASSQGLGYHLSILCQKKVEFLIFFSRRWREKKTGSGTLSLYKYIIKRYLRRVDYRNFNRNRPDSCAFRQEVVAALPVGFCHHHHRDYLLHYLHRLLLSLTCHHWCQTLGRTFGRAFRAFLSSVSTEWCRLGIWRRPFGGPCTAPLGHCVRSGRINGIAAVIITTMPSPKHNVYTSLCVYILSYLQRFPLPHLQKKILVLRLPRIKSNNHSGPEAYLVQSWGDIAYNALLQLRSEICAKGWVQCPNGRSALECAIEQCFHSNIFQDASLRAAVESLNSKIYKRFFLRAYQTHTLIFDGAGPLNRASRTAHPEGCWASVSRSGPGSAPSAICVSLNLSSCDSIKLSSAMDYKNLYLVIYDARMKSLDIFSHTQAGRRCESVSSINEINRGICATWRGCETLIGSCNASAMAAQFAGCGGACVSEHNSESK